MGITFNPFTGTLDFTGTGGGGGGTTPALPFNSVQFNNAGAFGGSADLTWDGTSLSANGQLLFGNLTFAGTGSPPVEFQYTAVDNALFDMSDSYWQYIPTAPVSEFTGENRYLSVEGNETISILKGYAFNVNIGGNGGTSAITIPVFHGIDLDTFSAVATTTVGTVHAFHIQNPEFDGGLTDYVGLYFDAQSGLSPSGVNQFINADNKFIVTATGAVTATDFGSGTWHGKSLTLAGNLTTVGAFASTFTMTGATNVTFPTSGTLSTTTGTVTSITASSPLTGGTITSTGSIGIADAAADGTTKGVATFTASDFNASTGLISLDYANGQKASATQPGFLSSTDWSTFNSKGSGTVTSIATTSPISGGTITGTGTLSLLVNVDFGFTHSQTITPGAAGQGGLSVVGQTETTSNPVLTATQTWNASGTTFTAWKLNVTNSAAATASLLMDLEVGSATQFSVRKDGLTTANGGITIAGGTSFLTSGRGGMAMAANGQFQLSTNGFGAHCELSVINTGTLQMGVDINGAAVSQQLQTANGITGTDRTGGSFTLASGVGTGAGAVSSLIFQTPTVLASGTTAQSLATRLTLNSAGGTFTVPITSGSTVKLGTIYTVSTLPAGSEGMIAAVSDALAPVFLGALTGGGTVHTPVYYNGSAWVAF